MTRYAAWLALEVADGFGGQRMFELLLKAQLEDLKERGIVTDYGSLVREVKPGERSSTLLPDGLLPDFEKA